MSRVDVVVPCFNYARYLERCVASVLDQPEIDVRVLIIDDCSSDDTAEVMRRLASRDARIECRRHDVNRGHIQTYNEGLLGWATGDYCLLISADDLVTPGAITRAAWVLDSCPDVGLCYGKQIVFSDSVPELPAGSRAADVSVSSGLDFWEQSCRTAQNLVATPTAVVRTSVQRAAGGYRETLPHSGDLEMWLRIAARADVAAIDAPQAFKRMHGQNMQVQYVSRAREDLRQRRLAFESALEDCQPLLPAASPFDQSFRRALSLEAFWAASTAFDKGDVADCEEWLKTARELDPFIVRRREWRRLSVKQRCGPRLWSVLQLCRERLRA